MVALYGGLGYTYVGERSFYFEKRPAPKER